MIKITKTTVLAAAIAFASAAPTFAATASNSQNGTSSTNPYATLEAPRSAAEVPATNTGLDGATGARSMRNGTAAVPAAGTRDADPND